MANADEFSVHAQGARIDALEMRVTYQDELIEQLDKVIIAQWTRLDQALGLIQRLEGLVAEGRDGAGQGTRDEPPPPHY
jgi:SlyX protein